MKLEVQTHHSNLNAKFIGAILGLAAVGMLLPLIFPLNPPQNSWETRETISLVFGGMYLFYVVSWFLERWMLPKHQLFCDDESLIWRSHRGTETVLPLADVTKATWRRGSDFRLELTTPSGRRDIDFKYYDRPDRLALIRRLSALIPKDIQIGWPAFCRANALPLHQSLDETPPTEQSGQKLKRSRWDFIFGMGLLAAIAIWPITGGISVLVMLELFLPMWLLVRMTWPKERASIPEQPPNARPTIITSLLMLIAAIPLSFAAASVAESLDGILGVTAAILIAASAFVPVFVVSHKYRDADNAWRERKQAEAVAEWNRLSTQNAGLA